MADALLHGDGALGFDVRHMDLPLTREEPISAYIAERTADPAPAFDVHSACELGVVLEGRYRRFYQGYSREVGPGQIWICGVWEPHGGQTLETPTRAVNVTFLLEALTGEASDAPPWSGLLLNHSEANRTIELSEEEGRRAIDTALELADECSGDHPWGLHAARLALKRLLLPILRRAESGPASPAGGGFPRIEGVIRMVVQSLPGNIPIEAAARVAHLSRSRFTEVFKRATGVPFGEFVQRARVARAAREIASSDTKMSAVADQWGYVDSSHMHRVFKRFFRCTPAEYRSRWRPA